MTKESIAVIELPAFDTGQYEGCEFHMVGGDASLVIKISEQPAFTIRFKRARWHRFTQLYSCDPSWIDESYFRLTEVSPEEYLTKYIESDRASIKAYKALHHFRIFLDETGCHEVIAESAYSE